MDPCFGNCAVYCRNCDQCYSLEKKKMNIRVLLFTGTFLLLIFYIPYVYAQENIETWNLTIGNSYHIPIATENVVINYIRAEPGNKILMYLSMEDSKNNGSIEFTFPEGAMSEIFNDSTCDLEFVQGTTELSVYVNQNMYSKIDPNGGENVKMSITLPSESSHVAIEGPCSKVLSNPEHQVYAVKVKSHEFSIPYRITDSVLEKITEDCDSAALIVQLEQTGSKATLAIDIPSTLLDVQPDKRENRDNLFTIVDGQEVEHHQIHSSSESRSFLIQIPPGGKVLEIIASSVGMFPEPVTCGIADSADSFYHQLLFPLQQYKNGVHRSEIICRDGLELTIKHNDLTPVCVKPETKAKLFERGWTTDATIHGESSRMCHAEPKTGQCKASIEKYYFDPETKSCKPFVWGGCQGTVPFDTIELCQSLCN